MTDHLTLEEASRAYHQNPTPVTFRDMQHAEEKARAHLEDCAYMYDIEPTTRNAQLVAEASRLYYGAMEKKPTHTTGEYND